MSMRSCRLDRARQDAGSAVALGIRRVQPARQLGRHGSGATATGLRECFHINVGVVPLRTRRWLSRVLRSPRARSRRAIRSRSRGPVGRRSIRRSARATYHHRGCRRPLRPARPRSSDRFCQVLRAVDDAPRFIDRVRSRANRRASPSMRRRGVARMPRAALRLEANSTEDRPHGYRRVTGSFGAPSS